MTTFFNHCDGAESHNLSWLVSTTGSPTNVSTNPATDARAYSLASTESITIPAETNGLLANRNTLSNTRMLVGFKVRFSDKVPSSSTALLRILDSGGITIAIVTLLTNSNITLRDEASTLLDTIVDPFTVNQYHRIEVAIQRDVAGTWEWWFDGVSQGSGTADFQNTAVNVKDIRLEAPTGTANQHDDIYIISDDTTQPTPLGDWEVFAFQAGSGATTTGTLTNGDETDIDELPFTDTEEIDMSEDNGEWSVETDAAGEGQAGPRLSGDIDGDDNIKLAVWHHQLKRTNGSGNTSLDQSFGNDTDTLQFVDRKAVLTLTYQNFFEGSDDKSTALPLSTEDFEYGVRKQGTGGRDIFCSGIFTQLLHQPADDNSSSSSSQSSLSSLSSLSSSSSDRSFIFDQRRMRFKPLITL